MNLIALDERSAGVRFPLVVPINLLKGTEAIIMKIVNNFLAQDRTNILRIQSGDVFLWFSGIYLRTPTGAIALPTCISAAEKYFEGDYAILVNATLTLERIQ